MTMGFEDNGDPPTGNPGVVDDSVEDGMDLEETTVSVVRNSLEKSGYKYKYKYKYKSQVQGQGQWATN
jgi:tRNA splicing ligase